VQAAYFLLPGANCAFAFGPLLTQKEHLRAAKARLGCPVELGGWLFQLQPYGSASGYPLVLKHPHYTVECGEFNSPSFFVTFRSEALWREGAATLHERFSAWTHVLGLRALQTETLSRVDFTFDYFLPTGAFAENSVVSMSAKEARYREDGRVQTLQYGKGDVVLRLYDKVTEIAQQSEKVWLFQLWGESENVWRIEWQVRKDVLRRFGIRTFEDLFANSGDVLRYLAHEHDSLRIPSADSNRSRWALHPLWLDLLEQIETFSGQGLYREVDEQAVLSERQQRLAISVYGYLKRLAALMSLQQDREIISVEESLERLRTLVVRLHEPVSWRVDVAAKREQVRLGR